MSYWPPLVHAMTMTHVGQQAAPLAPATSEERQQNQRFVDQLAEGFKQITPALVLTGLVIGLASGAGSTIGTALGTVFVKRFVSPRRSR